MTLFCVKKGEVIMERECGDCFYFKMDSRNFHNYCAKKVKNVNSGTPACSKFLTDECHDCCDCYYLEPTMLSFKCTSTGKKISHPESQPACSRFIEE